MPNDGFQHGVSDTSLVGQRNGRIPFGLASGTPTGSPAVFGWADAVINDIAEIEVMLVHHTISSVDDTHHLAMADISFVCIMFAVLWCIVLVTENQMLYNHT